MSSNASRPRFRLRADQPTLAPAPPDIELGVGDSVGDHLGDHLMSDNDEPPSSQADSGVDLKATVTLSGEALAALLEEVKNAPPLPPLRETPEPRDLDLDLGFFPSSPKLGSAGRRR